MQHFENSVGYARVSTTEQTVVNQIEKLKEVGVVRVFCDEGVSGKKEAMERAEYREMVRYLHQHPEIKNVVVYELSRLGRNMQDSFNTFLNLEKDGYHIISLNEAWTQTIDPNMRSLMLSIVSWMNEQELQRLSARTKAGLERVKKFGSKSGLPIGKPPKNLDKETVMKLKKEGKSWKAIADIFRVDISTLFRYRKQWRRAEIN